MTYYEEAEKEQATEDIEALKKELAEVKEKAEANLAGWQRERADFVNYKKRIEQEREDAVKCANEALILCILPVLDDFERATAHVPPEAADSGWVQGIKAVERKLRTILENQGVSPIEAVGKPFDINLHEAVMQGEGEEDIVVGEMQKGYKLYDKVIRPSKVIVGKGKD